MEKAGSLISRIRHLAISLIERYCPFNVTYFQLLTGVMMIILLGGVLVLGWVSSRKITEVVTEDFNQQQLILARHAASQVENSLKRIKRELSLLDLSPSVQYKEAVFMPTRMKIAFSSIKDEGALEIRFVNAEGTKTYVSDRHGYHTVHPYPDDRFYLNWARQPINKGNILMSDILPEIYEGSYQKPIMRLAMPVWQSSVDSSHPTPLNRFSGVLVFVVDATGLVENITKGIRSGRTGYSWVMDMNGTFIYHPEKVFIGKNAFEVRKEKKPGISYVRINEIQKNKMLKGQEGTSWYISGWHRGVEGEIEKLIAYTPIRLDSAEGRIWSVAVVAPIAEVEGAIHSIHIRQFSLQMVVLLAILLSGSTIAFFMFRWSSLLSTEVEKKTIELKKSEQRYKSLIENAEDIIFTADYNGNFLSINKYGAQFFGRRSEDIIGHNISEVLSWPAAEIPLVMIQEVFDTKEGRQITHPITIGGHEYWLNTNLRRLWDEEGNIYAVLGISRDISDRKKMEEQSYHTEKLASMGTLAAGVAHEINNPLGVILGFTDLLLEKTPQGSTEHDMLKTIEKHGLHAKRVVENLLSFARYTEYIEEDVDVNKGIDTVLSVVGNNLLLNKINVKKDFSDNLPPVRGNQQELQQVFFNIVNNAVSAMKNGGTLTVSTGSKDGDSIEMRFSDTGHGVRKEHRHRIFDPLFTTKKIGEGTGLGLSVSYGIITKYGGTISFETNTEEDSSEHGTTFIITLPSKGK